MINATISARLTGNPVVGKTSGGGDTCKRQGTISVQVKDAWFDENFTFVAYGKASDTLSSFTKPKIMVTGEWVIETPEDKSSDKLLYFHIAKIHNA